MIRSIEDLARSLENYRSANRIIIATSGGFDPIHIGHIRCIRESSLMAPHPILVVIVNGDGFLTRKKGKPFMCHSERMEIVDNIKDVDFVCGWDDGSQTVAGALKLLKPHYFTKGGDRSAPDKVPEYEICQKIGCEIIFDVGGEKIQSSSNLIKGVQ